MPPSDDTTNNINSSHDLTMPGKLEALVVIGDYCLEFQPRRARRFYREAAMAGHAPAMLRLGLVSRTSGKHREAIEWFTMAAQNGHPDGHAWLQNIGAPLQ